MEVERREVDIDLLIPLSLWIIVPIFFTYGFYAMIIEAFNTLNV